MKELRNLLRSSMSRRARPLALGAVVLLVVAQVVVFTPNSLEESTGGPVALDPDTLKSQDEITLASAVPKDRVPDYTVEQFEYVSSQGMTKQWKLQASRAFLYNAQHVVHSRRIKAFLHDAQGRVTVVTGAESQYFMNQRDLEIFGQVETLFPDGFKLKSDYLRYRPAVHRVEIPVEWRVEGIGSPSEETGGNRMQFTSRGFEYAMNAGEILLPREVRFVFERPKSEEGETVILSDRCRVDRGKQRAHFTMDGARPARDRFVRIDQRTLEIRSRIADLNYGSGSQFLQYLNVKDDVLIREKESEAGAARYATSGRADFDSRRNVIVLSDLPQVYQDKDTVTGDVILMHRDTDEVEVEQSNAYSQGSQGGGR